MEFKAAVCPNCGGELQVPENMDSVKCMYCGSDIVVRQAIQKAAGPKVENYLSLADHAINVKNYEEAYNYYSKVLEVDIQNPDAWYGKGVSAGWLSKQDNFKIPEMHNCFENCISYTQDKGKEELKKRISVEINNVSKAFFLLSDDAEIFLIVAGTFEEHLNQCDRYIKALEYAYSLDPSNLDSLRNIITICQRNIKGVHCNYNVNGHVIPVLERVSPKYKQMLQNKINKYSQILQQNIPSFQPPKHKKSRFFK